MTTSITVLPTTAQWRLVNLLAIRQAFTAERRASRMLNRADARPSDLGDLADIGWLIGLDEEGVDVKLADNWDHGLAGVHLRLTARGLRWVANSPHNQMLSRVADAQGALALKASELVSCDDVLIDLGSRRLVTMQTENGRDVVNTSVAPSRQFRGGTLYVRLTAAGQKVINP